MRQIIFAVCFAGVLVSGCGDGSSVTGSGSSVSSGSDRTVSLTLNIGEHRDIELPAVPDTLYSVSSRALATATGYNGSLSCTPSLSIGEIGTAENSVAYGIVNAAPSARPVLRLIGVYGQNTEKEIICVEAKDAKTGAVNRLKVEVTVVGAGDGDLIGGTPIDPNNPDPGTDPGTDPGGPPPPPTDPGDPGQATYDPYACQMGGFRTVTDTYNDVEGKFGTDDSAYIRSMMPGNVDSAVQLYYPAITKPLTITYTDLGRYRFQTKEGVMVEFDLQLGQHLFGLTANAAHKYFYVKSNNACMRGVIPTSVMTPPNKTLTWVTNSQ